MQIPLEGCILSVIAYPGSPVLADKATEFLGQGVSSIVLSSQGQLWVDGSQWFDSWQSGEEG